MEPVGNRRRVRPVLFRRKLIGFFLTFGFLNVMFVVLYPQIYAGRHFGGLNPTFWSNLNVTRLSSIENLNNENRIFDVKNEDGKATTKPNEFRFNKIGNLDGSKNLVKISPSITNPTLSNSHTKIMASKSTGRKNIHIPTKTEDTLQDLDEWFEYENGRKGTRPVDTSSYSQTVAAMLSTKAKQTTTENTKTNPVTKLTSTPKQAKKNSPTQNRERVKTSKASTLNSTAPFQEALLKMISSTKKNGLIEKNTGKSNLSMAAKTFTPTTSFQKDSIKEEPSCKPYELSTESIEYTKIAYAIQPEIAECQNQTIPNELCKVSEIKGNDLHMNLEIKCDFSVCDKAKKMVIEYMSHENGLMKKYEIPKHSNNNEIEKLVLIFADNARRHDLPFVFVNCTGVNGAIIAQMLSFLPSLPPLINSAHQNKININILLVDSVSRPHFYRSFPKTVSYLQDIKNDPFYPANIFNFELFQAVHGHTNENERALFDGSLFPVRLGGKRRDNTAVNLEPLYEVFKTAGFQTMFLDDLCWQGYWGIMDKYKVGRWKKLQKKLRVSSIDTRGISESSCTILNRNNMILPFYAGAKHQICFNAKHQHEYILNYITKYLDVIAHTPQSKPLFSYASTHVSHDNVGIRVQTLDKHLKDFIQKMSTQANTLSIIFADHGNTYTTYQAYADGKREMYHPFMLMVVPKKVALGGRVLRNLQENQRRLFNLFDVREGLMELSKYDRQSPLKPTGIFGKIAPNRSCDDLLLTEQSKCICQGWEKSVDNNTDQLVFAEYAIGKINNKIQACLLESRAEGVQYNKSRVVFGACQRLRVQNIKNVKTRKTRDGTKTTTMDVRVQSSNLLNQEELITVQVLSNETTAGTYDMTLIFYNRISTYGPYRTCMDKGVDVKLCVCNDHKDPQSQTTLENVVGKHSEVTKMQRCLYKIRRTYNDSRDEALVKVYEIANVCRNEEFTVRFEANDENIILSTRTPIIVELPPQTVKFIVTAKTIGNIKIIWHVEKKSA